MIMKSWGKKNMGSFAEICKRENVKIKADKKEEFEDRIEKLFQAGGMMDTEVVQLYGNKIVTIQKTQMDEDGMSFVYNYFEDDFWEDAGYSKKSGDVWSNKIGWKQFADIIMAGYALEELYLDGPAYTVYNGRPMLGGIYVGWINHLFKERFDIKNCDMWKTFESMHYDEYWDEREGSWYRKDARGINYISGCEIYAVLEGTEYALDKFSDVREDSLEKYLHDGMILLTKYVDRLDAYLKEQDINQDEYINELIYAIKDYYETGKVRDVKGKLKEEGLKVIECLGVSDAPAFCVKAIVERFDKDFWEVWEVIREVVNRKIKNMYYLVPYATNEFLRISTDEMLPWWNPECGWDFSEQINDWFVELKTQYESIMEEDFLAENPLKYIVDLLKYADDNYYQIYVFKNFFEETLSHINEKRYIALWKLFESMLYDPKMKQEVEVIFVPVGPEHEYEGIHDLEKTTKRRLKNSWDITDRERRNNKARVTLRRYLALLGNVELRELVFGF